MFQHRSTQKELLDAAVIPKADLFRNLYELDVINRFLGGHRATLSALQKLNLDTETTYTVIDIGCGGGDTLLAIAKWARKRHIKLRLIGVDLKPDCIEYASTACKDYPEISFLESDYKTWSTWVFRLILPSHRFFAIIFLMVQLLTFGNGAQREPGSGLL